MDRRNTQVYLLRKDTKSDMVFFASGLGKEFVKKSSQVELHPRPVLSQTMSNNQLGTENPAHHRLSTIQVSEMIRKRLTMPVGDIFGDSSIKSNRRPCHI